MTLVCMETGTRTLQWWFHGAFRTLVFSVCMGTRMVTSWSLRVSVCTETWMVTSRSLADIGVCRDMGTQTAPRARIQESRSFPAAKE